MTIDPKNIAKLKAALLKEKGELESNLGRIARPVDNRGDYETAFDEIGTDRDDNATEVEAYADNLPVEVTLEKKLHDVNAALAEMETGTYGICKNCNQEIGLARLNANPSARTCIACK